MYGNKNLSELSSELFHSFIHNIIFSDMLKERVEESKDLVLPERMPSKCAKKPK